MSKISYPVVLYSDINLKDMQSFNNPLQSYNLRVAMGDDGEPDLLKITKFICTCDPSRD